MIDLKTCSSDSIDGVGRALLTAHRDSLHSFEEVAITCVRSIYDTFRQPDGQNTFALVRIYRLCRYDQLLPELQAIANPAVTEWMALMGTVGSQPEWCNRRTSQGHKAIPAVGERSPMLTAAFEQIGLEQEAKSSAVTMQEAAPFTKYFHVPQALDSPVIPAQKEFVERYHIESVVGLGSRFLSNAAYLALCFSTVFISEEAARKFGELSPFVSTLLALYDGSGVLWM